MQVRSFLATTAATAAVSLLPISAQAATFGTSGIQFDQNTTVRFTFLESRQFFESSLAVYEVTGTTPTLATNGVLFQENKPPINPPLPVTLICGSSGAPTACNVDFTFRANTLYALGLRNVNPNDRIPGNTFSPIVYSTTALNTVANLGIRTPANPNIGLQTALFGSRGSTFDGVAFSNPGDFTTVDPSAGPFFISFEDGSYDTDGVRITTVNDRDFNDFQVRAEVIPAPPLLLGLLAMGARVFFRQRKEAQA